MTGVGMLLGTAAYMSPEQAKGREADKRSDIWAFGCVLYEMLTGRRAFDGDDMTEVLGAVVRAEPDWAALPSDVPQPVRTLLQQLSRQGSSRVAWRTSSTALFVFENAAGLAPPAAAAVGRADATKTRQARPHTRRECGCGFRRCGRGGVAWRCARRSRCRPRVPSASHDVRCRRHVPGQRPPIWLSRRTVPVWSTWATVARSCSFAHWTPSSRWQCSRASQAVRSVSPDGQWIGFFDGTSLKKVGDHGRADLTPGGRRERQPFSRRDLGTR